MNKLTRIDFDVSSDVSLDQLSSELLPLLKNQDSVLLLNPRGPGGGNTQVLIAPADEQDRDAVQYYMAERQLGAIGTVDSEYSVGVITED